jgi:hypothetical protein
MVGNAPQAFKGYAAQNRGGMLMTYPDGGMMPPQDQQMMQQQMMQEQQMQQQGGQEQMMQMVQQVAQMLMQGAQPEQIMQQLVQAGVPQEQAQQIIQVAMQELQGQQQQQPMQGQKQMMPQQGMMSSGGKLPREILRARAEAHMSPKEASNYVNNYSSGGNMYAVGGPPYDLPGMADMNTLEYNPINTYLTNLNTPNYVNNQGNTSSILSRMSNSQLSNNQPLNIKSSFNSPSNKQYYTSPAVNSTTDGSHSMFTTSEDGYQVPYYDSSLDQNTNAAAASGFNFSGPPVIDIPSSDQYSVGELTDDSRFWDDETEYPTVGTAKTPNGMGMNFKNAQQMGNQITTILQNQKSNNPNNINQNTNNSSNLLSGIGMASGLIGPLAHLINNKKPKPFNYVKPTPTTLNPTAALAVARKFANDKYNKAAYTIKQNSPTSGSHLANTLVNTQNAAMNDALAGATIQSGYDRENANIYNTFAQNNAAISNKNIDEMRADKGNYATQNTNAFYNLGANIQGGIRNMNQGRMDDLIANNIGTSNYKLVGNKIIYELNGKTIVKSLDDLQTT